MTAIACLKVFVGEDPAETERNAPLIAKIAGDYLKGAWLAPRRHGLVAPFSFVLADPRATRLDARELQALARALHDQRKQNEIHIKKALGDIVDALPMEVLFLPLARGLTLPASLEQRMEEVEPPAVSFISEVFIPPSPSAPAWRRAGASRRSSTSMRIRRRLPWRSAVAWRRTSDRGSRGGSSSAICRRRSCSRGLGRTVHGNSAR